MLVLILIVIFGVIFAYFATLNTGPVSIYFATYSIQNIPLYLVVLLSLGLGLVISGLISFVGSLSSSLTISEKQGQVNKLKKENTELTKRIHQLELENTKLKTKEGTESVDENSI